MDKVARLLVAIVGIMCLGLWARWAFDFDGALQQWALQPVNPTGINHLRGDLGGLFLALAVFCGLYFRHGKIWLKAAIVLTGGIAVMRVFSLLVDGFDQMALISLGVEIVFIIIFLAAPAGRRHD
jgi:hypothetical protein